MKELSGTFIVEGIRSVEAILDSPLKVQTLVVIRPKEKLLTRMIEKARKRGIEVRHVDERHAKKYLSTASPQGVAAIVEGPKPPDVDEVFERAKRVLVLDGVSDPGNAGTLIRTACLFQWDAVFLTPGSANPYGEKAVRASAGAVGFTSIGIAPPEQIAAAAGHNGFSILIAAPDAPGSHLLATAHSLKLCLVLGNEAHGPGTSWKGIRVGVPIMKSPVDSLGVVASGAILLEQFRIK